MHSTSSYIILASILLCHMHTSSYSSSIYTLVVLLESIYLRSTMYTNSDSHRCLYYFSSSKRAHFRLSLSIAYSTYLCYDSYHLSTLEYLLDHGVLLFLKSVHSLTRSMGEGTNLRCISSRLQYPTSGHSGNSQRFILSLLGPMLWSGGTVPANQICLMPSSSASC